MPQLPQTGTLEQSERMLSALAMSAAFTTEVQLAKASAAADLSYAIVDANGVSTVIKLTEQAYPDMTWIADTFAKSIVSGQINLTPPYPIIRVAGKPSSYQVDSHGATFRDSGYTGQRYHLECDVYTSRDQADYAQREALILSRALETLVRRNEQLGGLVQLIQPISPVEPGGSAQGKSGIIGAARQIYEVLALSVP